MNSKLFDRLVAVRRDIHRHPELSWNESRTAGVVTDFLRSLGIRTRAIARTGVVAEIAGADPKLTVAIRADMDALPLREETGLAFASATDGVMHACGHDGHTAIVLGAAALLAEKKPAVSVRLLFQPAEEVGEGAEAMIRDGVLDGVRAVFGGHLDREFPAGTIVLSAGPVNAASDVFEIEIQGEAAHGARPHEGRDALLAGSHVVTALQSLVARELNPADCAVVTVGMFQAGSAPNVIAGNASLRGTIRAMDPAVMQRLREGVTRTVKAVAESHGARAKTILTLDAPAVVNDAGWVQRCREAAASAAGGPYAAVELPRPNMGAEDFGYYLEKVPGCYARFGARLPKGESHPAHSTRYDFDERAIAVGAQYFAALVEVASRHLIAGK